MSLFTITIIVAIALIFKGIIWFLFPEWTDKMWRFLLRNIPVSFIVFVLSGLWFLWNVAHLGEADFGQYKNWLLLIFIGVIIGSLLFLKDFLIVRGIAILQLLISKYILDIAYMQPLLGRLFLVAFVYFMIIEALYFGALPYKLRDLLNWIFAAKYRVKQVAIGFAIYGLILISAAFTY